MLHNAEFYQKGIEKLFYIVDKDMKSTPFTLNPPQKRMLQELTGMDIILKARKEGISSLILAMFTLDWLTVENCNCVVISHEDKATQRLFDKVKYCLESMQRTWPKEAGEPFQMKYNSKREIVNLAKNSKFYIGTAGARAFARGDTINNLHISELAFWPDQEGTMIGLVQAVPQNGNIIIETTANGVGDYFYKMWIKNKQNADPFMTHFIPWFELPEYVYPLGTTPMELTPEEQEMSKQYSLTKEQLMWRRYKIGQMQGDYRDPNTWDKFAQEYPMNPEEAFIVSGNPVWSPNLIKFYLGHTQKPLLRGNLRGFDPISVEANEKGPLKIWKEPDEFHTYAIGVDVSEGKLITAEESGKERDASCAQVFDKTTYEQVAVWHGRVDPDILGRELDMLGRYYNNALIGVERNAVGITPLIKLRDLNYPNLYYREKLGLITEKITAELGWLTTNDTKEGLIADATNLLRDKRITVYDEDTVDELRTFVRDASGHANAAKSAYDDRVMAFMIGLRMLSKAKSINLRNEIEMSDDDLLTGERGFFMGGQSFNSQGMPVHPNDMDTLTEGEMF